MCDYFVIFKSAMRSAVIGEARPDDRVFSTDIEVPSLVDGKRRNLARVSDFVSWDEACLVPRHKITHSCKIPPLSIHE